MNPVKCLWLLLVFQLSCSFVAAQNDSVKFDRAKIFSVALDADIPAVLKLIDVDTSKPMSDKDRMTKNKFEERFIHDEDRSSFLEERKSRVDDLLRLFCTYWRISLLNPDKNYDTSFSETLLKFSIDKFNLGNINPPDSLLSDTLGYFLTKYINDAGYYTTGFGKTGKLLDLLVWKKQSDTTYKFSFLNDELKARVVFMYDFITLGWEEYASLGVYYPGGWATDKELFCVRDAYDLNSENFKVGYLAHESRHLSDNIIYPGRLSDAEMEYRAKITEICLAKSTLFDKIKFFISGANSKSDNAHPLANYFVIKHLSEKLFGIKFEKDIEKWKQAGTKKINEAGYSLLKENDDFLIRTKETKEHFIKKEN